MVHFSNGRPMDSLVYGRRTGYTQYYPSMNIKRGTPVIIQQGCNCNHSEQVDNGGVDKWALWAGILPGALGGLGMILDAAFGNKNATKTTSGQVTNNNNNDDALKNLKSMFGDFKITSQNGKFYATDKNGVGYGPYDTFDEAFEGLSKVKEESVPEHEPIVEEPPLGEEPATLTPSSVDTIKGVDDPEKGVVPPKKEVDDSEKGVVAPKKEVDGGGGKDKVKNVTPSDDGSETDKTKPMDVKITFSINTLKGTNTGTAKVVMPDGKTYAASTGFSLTHNSAMRALANDIRGQLEKDGWTNVTLVNENFNFKQVPESQKRNTAAAQGTQGTQGAQQKEWTAAEKAKPITLNIRFAIHTTKGNYGNATVTTPDGKTYTVKTGISWTQQTAMEDLSKQLKEALAKDGWTNVTLENQNFNWSD